MKRNSIFAAAAFAAAAGTASAQPATLHGASVEVRSVAPGGLAAEIRRAKGASPHWVAWAAPSANPRRRMCCFSFEGDWHHARRGAGGSCRLDREESYSMIDGDDDAASDLVVRADFFVFVRLGARGVEAVRAFSPDCVVEAGRVAVTWLDGVAPAESVAWLESLVPTTERASRRDSDEDGEDSEGPEAGPGKAISAIALHAGPEATAALTRFVAPAAPAGVRKKAAFWLANRGEEGCRTLEKIVPNDASDGFRKHGTFALSLCKDSVAIPNLVAMARKDPNPKVRSQALFWLAQKAGKRAAGPIDDAIRDDPDTEVKRQAVFALTQMPDNEGVPELIHVARTNGNPAVRERAVFWLGQSEDPRALDFIEEILTAR